MASSRTARRMSAHHERAKKTPAFNIVSLMDIFTILVFFLLVNAADPSVLPNAKGIEMPESMAEKKPRVSVVVMLDQENVSLQGNPVAESDSIIKNDAEDIHNLMAALQAEAEIVPAAQEGDDPKKEVTIMGDKEVSFQLIKRVMQICSDAGFTRISLSVIEREPAQAS